MLNQFLNFISTKILIREEEKILLAVSGGIDSMVMAHLFSRASFPIAIAHCNFGLRGEESDGDQQFVFSFAANEHIPCHIKSFDTLGYAHEHGVSIQMAARELRREWFEALCQQEHYASVATAHHLNDALETVLFNLAKGTGIAGLKGILPHHQRYIRPLMFASREMIEHYAREQQLNWREDKSNSTIKYHRNLIRHQVVPELKKINPSLENTLAQSLEKIAAAERIFRLAMEKLKKDLITPNSDGFGISKYQLQQCPEATLVLFEILEPLGFNYHQCREICQNLDSQPGTSFLSSTYRLIIDREYVFVHAASPKHSDEITIVAEDLKLDWAVGGLVFEKSMCSRCVLTWIKIGYL
ncbi:MAG: tRNA lysidine(34) synthetase TilS [Cyclobacteriaceae bacterium]|nr:tRNA lysidine(34) synthetase TilS [Cyclobacteriaceae bacterium]